MSENNNTVLKLKTGDTIVTDLDSIVYENLTYRDIFETNSVLTADIQPGFADGTLGTMDSATTTDPVIVAVSGETDAVGGISPYVAKVFNTKSTWVRTSNPAAMLAGVTYYMATRVKCLRYVQGTLGVTNNNNVATSASIDRVTSSEDNNWEIVSAVYTPSTDNYQYIGAAPAANLDGYIDLPMCTPLTIFTNIPTKEVLDKLYGEYLAIKKDGSIIVDEYRTLVDATSGSIVSDYHASRAIVEDTNHNKSQITTVPYVSCTRAQAIAAFYQEMNDQAAQIGMSQTVFQSAAGWPNTNTTTTNDMVRLNMKGMAYPIIGEIWQCPSKTIYFTGNPKTINAQSSVTNRNGWQTVITDAYNILGGKTGSGEVSGTQVNNYCITLEAKDTLDVFTICCSASGYTDSASRNRFINCKKLADIGKLLVAAGEYGITDSNNIQNAETKAAVQAIEATLFGTNDCNCGTVCLTPDHPTAYDGKALYDGTDHKFIYSYGGTTTFPALSTTKMMTLLLTVKWIADLHATFEITPADITTGAGPAFEGGEVCTFEDALYLIMLASSNTLAETLARVVGEKIYSVKNRP